MSRLLIMSYKDTALSTMKGSTIAIIFWGGGVLRNANSPGGLYLEGRFSGGFFVLRVWGANIWRGLFSEFYSISQGFPKFQTSLPLIFF